MTADRPVLLIYSNCQADHIAKLLESIEPLTSEISVKYLFIHSLEDPGHGWDTYDENYMEGVCWVWEQVSEAFPLLRTELHRRLPPHVRRIRFPAFTAGMIWPFAAADQRPSKRNLYLYGDSIAHRLGRQIAGKTVSDDDIFDQYMEMSAKRIVDLDRRLELEIDNWRKRDLDSDIVFADYVLENFRKVQLFYEPTRVTQNLVHRLTQSLLWETFGSQWTNMPRVAERVTRLLRDYVGYDTISRPVHPLVAEKLKLEWYDPNALYRWFAHDWTFREWIVRCTRLTPYVGTLF